MFDDIGLGEFVARRLIFGGVFIALFLGLSIYYFKKYYRKGEITLKRLVLLASIVITLFISGVIVGGIITTIQIVARFFFSN